MELFQQGVTGLRVLKLTDIKVSVSFLYMLSFMTQFITISQFLCLKSITATFFVPHWNGTFAPANIYEGFGNDSMCQQPPWL
jgi:hypothetical protein